MVNTSLTDPFDRVRTYSIGFDRMFDNLMNVPILPSSYPPYNIVKHDDDKFTIEIAVAGFGKNEIEIETRENTQKIDKKDQRVMTKRNIYIKVFQIVHSKNHLHYQMM